MDAVNTDRSEGLNAVFQLQGVLKDLVQSHDDAHLCKQADKALQLLGSLPSLDCGDREQRSLSTQLHTSGISLWNRTVTLKSAGAIALSLNAQLRYIACSLVLMANPSEPSESSLHKQITMATKTGRAWLDCENFTMAEASLVLASECWEKLKARFPETEKEHASLRSYFRVLCFRAEAAIGQREHDAAVNFVQQAKELLHLLESEAGYLAMMCYNFGVDVFQLEEYQHSVTWLKESYEIGRIPSGVGAVKQARTLRLLANAYLEWDGVTYWQKALNAVGLANSEHSHPVGHLLKTSILLQHDTSNERLSSVFEDTLHHPDLMVETALATVRQAAQHNRHDLAFSGIQLLTVRYQNTPDLPRIHLLHLEMLIERGQLVEAKQLVEDCIAAHNTGDPLDVKSLRYFHLMLWEQASRAYEASDHAEALEWYNYSLSFFPAREEKDKNVAKLQRNRCSCYLNLKHYEKAVEAVQQAKDHDPECAYTHFLAFKLALLLNQQEEAIQSLQAMSTSSAAEEEDSLGLISLAAQMAFERSNRDLAMVALEKLVDKSPNTQQVLTALRCLLRLKHTFLNSESVEKLSALHSMLSYIQRAIENLGALSSSSSREAEAVWFMKIAWNLALQCGEHYHEMSQLFTACHQLLGCAPLDSSMLQRQKTCQLMAAGACVQVARSTNRQEEKSTALEAVLEHISECRTVCQQLDGGVADSSDPTFSLLALYEFEAKLHLGHPDLEGVLEKISSTSLMEPKTFETIAALSIQVPARGHTLGVRALKMAVQCHLRASQLDCDRLSKCYHSLVQLSMGGAESSSDMASKEQAWAVLVEVLDLLQSRAKDKFPEMEILWFLTKAWNCGIHLYSSLRFREAEQWCSLGLRFLKHLDQQKPVYEEQMTTVYTEVLSRVQSHQLHTLQ